MGSHEELAHDRFQSLNKDLLIKLVKLPAEKAVSVRELLTKQMSLTSRALKIVHINAQSLPQHIDYAREVFHNRIVDAVAVSETWLKPTLNATLVQIPGYNLFRNDRIGKVGGGVGVYLREEFKAKIVASSKPNYNERSEYMFIEIKLPANKLLFAVIYKPPTIDNTFEEFEECLLNLAPTYEHVIIVGDHNADLASNKPEAVNIKKLYEASDMNILPVNPTHKKAILDLLIVKNKSKVTQHGQMPAPGFSHHDLIYLTYSLRTPKFRPKIIKYRDFSRLNEEKFRFDAKSAPWHLVEEAVSLEGKIELFNSLLLELYNKHAPIVERRVTHPPAPWLSSDIKALMAERDMKYSLYRKGDLGAFVEFKKLRNIVNQKIRNSKIKFAYSLSSESGKQLWRKLKSYGVGNKTELELPDDINVDELNQHFTSIVPIPDPQTVDKAIKKIRALPCHSGPEFKFQLVGKEEVTEVLRSIKSQAVGTDGISIKLILNVLDEIINTITHIFNFSLYTGDFPTAWKRALVRPLPKKKEISSYNDLRPINILPAISKALEKIICSQITEYLDANKLADPFQSGFKKYHSTTTAMIHVMDELAEAKDKGHLSILTLLDFSKAFDSLQYDIFIAILRNLKFSEGTITWFDNYLKGREQRVVVGDRLSKTSEVKIGVMQGTASGPLCYSLYVLGLEKYLKFTRHHAFADDIQLYHSFKSTEINKAILELNSDLKAVEEWSKDICLSLNAQKTKCILIGSKNIASRALNDTTESIKLNNTTIPFENQPVVSLGLTIDTQLSWEAHISRVCKNVYGSLHSLNRLRNILPSKIKKQLVNSLIMPQFDYGDVVYAGCNETLSTKLDKALNSSIRFIFKVPWREHLTPYYKELKWLKLADRRELHTLSLMYKMLKNEAPIYLQDKFTQCFSLRNGVRFQIPQHNSGTYSEAFRVRAIKSWNELPHEIRSSESVRSFKKRTAEYLITNSVL